MKILVVEDEAQIIDDIAICLEEAGYVTTPCFNGDDAFSLGCVETFDAVVLDLGLPKLDGLTVLRRWRAKGVDVPVIILTARGSWIEKVEGLNAGADDYLLKPFQMLELLARLEAVLRRGKRRPKSVLTLGGLILDPVQMKATLDGRDVNLTHMEFRLLRHLLHHSGSIVSREQLMENVYGQNDGREENAIEAMIARLRKKIGDDIIETRRGRGYTVSSSK